VIAIVAAFRRETTSATLVVSQSIHSCSNTGFRKSARIVARSRKTTLCMPELYSGKGPARFQLSVLDSREFNETRKQFEDSFLADIFRADNVGGR
jgi:hypothetical protein